MSARVVRAEEGKQRTQGNKLLMISDTFTPSSSLAAVPCSLAKRIEKVGKAMAAKSESRIGQRGRVSPSRS